MTDALTTLFRGEDRILAVTDTSHHDTVLREMTVRALANVLCNAVEAGAHIVQVEEKRTNNDTLVIVRITDDGPGLLPKARRNLFQPFVGSARPEGTGLRLPIARELMVIQGGDVVLVQTGEAGTIFEVRFPLFMGVTLDRGAPTSLMLL